MNLRTHFMMVGNITNFSDSASILRHEDNRLKWHSLYDAFTAAGATVTAIDGYDPFIIRQSHIYCRDQSLIIGSIAYLPDTACYPYDEENFRPTLDFVRRTLGQLGYETITVKDAWFEGGNILRHDSSRTLFAGINKDTAPDYPERLLRAINDTQTEKWDICPVPMKKNIDPETDRTLLEWSGLYHLDLGLTDELPNGEMLVYPGITDERTVDAIGNIVGREKLIPVTDVVEVYNAALNLNHTGNTVILTSPASETVALLKAQSYDVITPDRYGVDNFSFGDAGVHCLTNELRPA